MSDFPDFHGDMPLNHSSKAKDQSFCKCGTNCHCNAECDCESCGCLSCSPVQPCGCKWNQCECEPNCECGPNCACCSSKE